MRICVRQLEFNPIPWFFLHRRIINLAHSRVMFACPSPTFPPDKCGHGGLEGDMHSKANANGNASAVGPNSLLMEDFDIGDAWLDSFNELETFNSQHQPNGQAEARVHGGNAWADATRPMPILAQGQFKSIEELASFESSQSVLRGFPDGSYTDDSVLIRHQPGSATLAGHHYGSAPVLPFLGQAYSGDDMYTDKNTTPKPDTHHNYVTPTFIPAPGGHWAWVPSSKTNPAPPPPVIPVNPVALQTSMSMPLLSELQGAALQDNTTEGALNTTTDASFRANLDLEGLELLDSLDFMDVADTLVGEYEGEFNVSGANSRKDYKHMFGSAPLPAVLEDSVSGGGEISVGSGNSMPSSEESLPPGAMPIPNTRLLRTSSSSGTLSMHKSASNPNLLPASCPVMERPVRSAARRSLALAAAALRDVGTSSESEEDGMRDDDDLGSSYGRAVHHLRRSSGSLRQDRSQLGTTGTSNPSISAALGKKKHNPWSMEETNALIEGVRLLGVGKWAEIKRLPYPGISKTLETRSPVDLKDKWRNLNRVARMSKSNLKSRFQKTVGEVPPNV